MSRQKRVREREGREREDACRQENNSDAAVHDQFSVSSSGSLFTGQMSMRSSRVWEERERDETVATGGKSSLISLERELR